MKKHELRNEAKKRIRAGLAKQEVFDELKNKAIISNEELAKYIQDIPSLAMREKYKTWQSLLIVLLVVTIVFKLILALPFMTNGLVSGVLALLFVPLVNVLLLIGVVRYSTGAHKFVAVFTIISLLRVSSDFLNNPFEDIVVLLSVLIAGALIFIGFYLSSKLHPAYEMKREKYLNKDGESRMRYRYIFPD